MGFQGGLGIAASGLGELGLGAGLPSPVSVPPYYDLTTSRADGTDESDPIPLSGLGYSELLDDSWTARWTCDEHVAGAARDVLQLGRRVSIYRYGDLRWSGLLWSVDLSSEEGPRFQAAGIYELLKYRFLLAPDVLSFTAENPWDMAEAVLDYANAQGGLDVTYADRVGLAPHDFSAEFHWWDGASIADALQSIAQLPYLAYDYFVDQFRVWHVVRRTGVDTPRDPNPDVVLERGVNIESLSGGRELIDTGTQVLSVGANEGASMLYSLSDVDDNADLYGLLQMFDASAQTRFGQRDQDFLDTHNANVLANQRWPQERLTVKVNLEEIGWTLASIGDIITVRYYEDADAGADGSYTRIDDDYVLAQRSVHVGASGREESDWMFLTPDRFRA